MNRIPFGWIALALLPTTILVYTSVAQSPATTSSPTLRTAAPAGPVPFVVQSSWPPKPQDIRSFAADLLLNVGSQITVFTVPADRSFVLTDARVVAGAGHAYDLHVIQGLGGTLTVKRAMLDQFGPTSGLLSATAALGPVFTPGSQVIIRNEPAPWDPTGSDLVGRYELIGYLAQP